MDIDVWIAFLFASTALLIIPGPTILLVLSYALTQGKETAVATAAGVALGDFIAMTASLLGLGALVLTSAALFTALKYLGAAYLIYLGIMLIRHASDSSLASPEIDTKASPKITIFTHAATVTALNPKSIVFFIAFVPQFINTEKPLLVQFVVLIVTFVSLATINAISYALVANKLRQQIAKPAILTGMSRIGGAALIGMGLVTAVFRQSSA